MLKAIFSSQDDLSPVTELNKEATNSGATELKYLSRIITLELANAVLKHSKIICKLNECCLRKKCKTV